MSMTKSEITQVFRLGALNHLNDVEVNENDRFHVFSDNFSTKMKKLIKKQQKSSWRITNTIPKKTATALIAIVVFLVSTYNTFALSKNIVDFVIKQCESFYELFSNNQTTDHITREFNITELPDNFILSQMSQTNDSRTLVYVHENEYICFIQKTSKNNSIIIDSDRGSLTTIEIECLQIHYYETDHVISAIWMEDGYIIELTCNADIKQEDVLKMIKSVQ